MLDTAEQRLASGFSRTALPDIAAALGMSVNYVRALFGNREALVERLLDRHMDRLIDRLGVYQSHNDATDPAERLSQAIASLLDIVWAYRAGHRLHVAVSNSAPPQLAASLKLRQRHLVHVYAGLIAAAVPEAEANELAMPAALNLMGMISWHVLVSRDGRVEPRRTGAAHGRRARRGPRGCRTLGGCGRWLDGPSVRPIGRARWPSEHAYAPTRSAMCWSGGLRA
ncbi:MAG: TetR/AcrR family transcriptional regulator [Acetobacteraceae bacterium]